MNEARQYAEFLVKETNKLLPNVDITWKYNGYNLGITFFITVKDTVLSVYVSYTDVMNVNPEHLSDNIIRQAQLTLKEIMTNNLQ